MRDSELVASIVAGDPAGLAAAYDRYAGTLFGYCRSLLREPADAADVVHDTFVIAAVSLDQLRDSKRLRPWLYAVARNLALRQLRADKVAAVYPAVAPDGDIGHIIDLGADVERAELHALLHAATGGLNPRERDIIELRLWQGLDTADTAAVMGISTAHANSMLYRARNQLTAAVGVVLVARAGPGDCARLKGILSGWDGHLTPLLRKRLSRHIRHCRTCSDLRNQVLRPTLLTLWPAGTLAAAVAGEQAQYAAAVPAGLKDQVLRAAAVSRDADAGKSTGAGGARGLFGKNGFPNRRSHLRTITTMTAAGVAVALLTLALVARAHPTMIYLSPNGGGQSGTSPAAPGGGAASPGSGPGQGGHGGKGPAPVITVVPVAASSQADLPTVSAGPTTRPPTTAPPSSAPPTTVPPTIAPPTTVPPTTPPPTTPPPTTPPPTTPPPTTPPPTTPPPTTPPPTTAPPTTPPPTTPPPTTPPPTTAPPTTAPPTAPAVTGTGTASPTGAENFLEMSLPNRDLATGRSVCPVRLPMPSLLVWQAGTVRTTCMCGTGRVRAARPAAG